MNMSNNLSSKEQTAEARSKGKNKSLKSDKPQGP